jgi:hypothetical protein
MHLGDWSSCRCEVPACDIAHSGNGASCTLNNAGGFPCMSRVLVHGRSRHECDPCGAESVVCQECQPHAMKHDEWLVPMHL